MYNLELCTFMYKHSTNHLPEVFRDYFCTHNQIHNYNTRNKESYTIPIHSSDFAHKTVKTMGPVKWNGLTKDTKISKNVKALRAKLRNTLMSKYV